jgi:hypothetical protein
VALHAARRLPRFVPPTISSKVGNESYRFPRRLVIANDNARLSRDVFSPPLQIFETHHTSEQNQGSLSPYDGQCANVASWGAKQYQYGDRGHKERRPKKPNGVESLGSEVLHVADISNLSADGTGRAPKPRRPSERMLPSIIGRACWRQLGSFKES